MLLNSSGILTSGSNLRCQYSAAGVPLRFLPEPQRTNLLLNSAALATQGVTVSAATAYTLSFKGTGTVTLSGVSSAGPLVGTWRDGSRLADVYADCRIAHADGLPARSPTPILRRDCSTVAHRHGGGGHPRRRQPLCRPDEGAVRR